MNRFVRPGIFIIAFFLTACHPRPKEKTADELSRGFMKLYETRGSTAVSYFFEGNRFGADEDDLTSVANQLDTLTSYLGNYRGYELIATNHAGDNFVVFSYLLRFDRQPVRFNLMYYRPDKKWLPYNFSFDTRLKKELDNSTELIFLNKTFQPIK